MSNRFDDERERYIDRDQRWDDLERRAAIREKYYEATDEHIAWELKQREQRSMRRWDSNGRDVTDLPGLWSKDDCEVVATNYSHPEITSGQHTNGPADIWIRQAEVGQWIPTHMRHMHRVRELWQQHRLQGFECVQDNVERSE